MASRPVFPPAQKTISLAEMTKTRSRQLLQTLRREVVALSEEKREQM